MLERKDYRTPTLIVIALDPKDDILEGSNELKLQEDEADISNDIKVGWKG